jgi:hypothetical protein
MSEKNGVIRICRVKCNRCGDVLEYEHKCKTETPHVLLTCTCRTITIDPAPMSARILYKNEGDFTELHEYWEKPSISALYNGHEKENGRW